MDKEQLDILDKIEKLIKENEELKTENKRPFEENITLKIEKGKQDISDLDKVPNGYYIPIPVDNKALLFLLERIFSLGKIHGVTCSYRVEEGKQFVDDIRKDKVLRVYEIDADEYVETRKVNEHMSLTSTEIKKGDN